MVFLFLALFCALCVSETYVVRTVSFRPFPQVKEPWRHMHTIVPGLHVAELDHTHPEHMQHHADLSSHADVYSIEKQHPLIRDKRPQLCLDDDRSCEDNNE